MDSEKYDRKMEYEFSMGIFIWMLASFALWIVLLLLFIIL